MGTKPWTISLLVPLLISQQVRLYGTPYLWKHLAEEPEFLGQPRPQKDGVYGIRQPSRTEMLSFKSSLLSPMRKGTATSLHHHYFPHKNSLVVWAFERPYA